MKIAVLSFCSLGGSGVVAGELSRELARRGHELHVFGASLPGRLDPPPPGVFHHKVALDEPLPVGTLGYPVSLAARLIEVAREGRIELIHAHYAVPHAMAAQLARAALGADAPPLVVTFHGSDVPTAAATPGQVSLARRAALDAAALTAPSRSLAEQARARLELPEGAFEAIPNFVDPARFHPPETKSRATLAAHFTGERDWASLRVLFHASNFRPVKRVLDVVAAFALVRARVPAVLVMAGEGPDRRAAELAVAEARLTRDVAFVGAVPQMEPLLHASDLFLLPSLTESFGLAALEAMSCGVPVLATNAGGLPEVVGEGEGGILVPPRSPEQLGAAALSLLQDEGERQRLSRGARDRAVRLFQPGPVVARWEALYRRVLAHSR